MIYFNSNPKKLLEVAVYLMHIGEKINLYNLLKCVFYADEYHLNAYARPVSGDYFVAMPFGTVPANIDKIVNERDNEILAILNLNDYPFDKDGYFLNAAREPEMAYLSNSDKEALDYAYKKYGKMEFNELKAINHRHKAYDNTVKNNFGRFNGIVDFVDMISDSNPERTAIIEHLEELSQNLVF
ncbi:MAG: SocA family protein [Rickettsiales bacterium]|jgi:uncharacterized phage-associated protein|nr:SocA family protein [Rickettsiales bacterium]